MNAESIEEMKKIAKGDDAMKQAIAYVDQFLKEEGTTFQDKIEYEKAKGEAKGKRNTLLETARNMLDMNMPVADISKATGLSKTEIEALKK